MRTMSRVSGRFVATLGAVAAAAAVAIGAQDAQNRWPGTKAGQPAPKVPGVPGELAKNLATFDDLDFRVYSGQQWQELHKSHAKDIVVQYPDGHTTKGLDAHIKELQPLFTFAPDTKITEHPVRFGTADAEWTAVTGWLEGTFSKPMALPNGKSVSPTGKRFRVPMITVGHWNQDGVMSEEFLFWDNAGFMQQIGAQ